MDKNLITTGNNQITKRETCLQSTMLFAAKMAEAAVTAVQTGSTEVSVALKMELINHQNEVMTNGKPDMTKIGNFPQIADLYKTWDKTNVRMAIYLLILDFAKSLNVKYKMDAGQM